MKEQSEKLAQREENIKFIVGVPGNLIYRFTRTAKNIE